MSAHVAVRGQWEASIPEMSSPRARERGFQHCSRRLVETRAFASHERSFRRPIQLTMLYGRGAAMVDARKSRASLMNSSGWSYVTT